MGCSIGLAGGGFDSILRFLPAMMGGEPSNKLARFVKMATKAQRAKNREAISPGLLFASFSPFDALCDDGPDYRAFRRRSLCL